MQLQDASRVHTLVRRLEATGKPFEFLNTEGSVQFVLTVSKPVQTAFFIQLKYDMLYNDETIEDIVFPRTYNEDTYDVIAYWHIRVDEGPSVQYVGVMDKINECLQMRVCDCGKHFVYDTNMFSECFHCALFNDVVHCEICARDGPRNIFCNTPCCAQTLHSACLGKCEGRCPFCRSSLT